MSDDTYADFEPEFEPDGPMLDFDLEVGDALPAGAIADLNRLKDDIESFGAWVDSVQQPIPKTMHDAWKLWSKGTVESLEGVIKRNAATSISMPIWPAGVLLPALMRKELHGDQVDEAFVAGEIAKLGVWKETFRSAGLQVPGLPPPVVQPAAQASVPGAQGEQMYIPAQTPEPGFFSTTAGKGVMIGSGIVVALLLANWLSNKSAPQPVVVVKEGY